MSLLGASAGPLNCQDCYGHLAIGDVSMHTPAWCMPDLSVLWGTPTLRGANRLIPGRQGRKAYKRRIDETHYSLPLLVTGYCDENGVPWANQDVDWNQGLEANVAFLQDNVANPDTDRGDSTVRATFTLPSGNTRRSWVQILGITGGLNVGGVLRATLELLDTEGKLTVGGEAFVDA